MRLRLALCLLLAAAPGCDSTGDSPFAGLDGPPGAAGQAAPPVGGPGAPGGGPAAPGGGPPAPPGGGPAPTDPDALVVAVRERLADAGVTPIPAAPTVAPALFELGQALAFDKELSGNRDISCMTCHHPSLGTDDDRTLPAGTGANGLGAARSHPDGVHVPRNAPALFNLHAFPTMFWDSRVAMAGPGGQGAPGGLTTPAGGAITPAMAQVFAHGVVSAQAMFPVTSAVEMRGEPGENELADLSADDLTGIWAGLMHRLGAIPGYVSRFEAAYPGSDFDDMTFAHAANAIAAFEVAGFESRGSPFDRFVAGDDAALSLRELQGALAFFDSGCARCHRGPTLSDFAHHNTALAQLGPGVGDGPQGDDDFGRQGVTGDGQDRWAFRTTPLHNVELTGPYGHAGQLEGLDDIVRHYANPAQALRTYEVTDHVADASLHDTVLGNTEAIIDRIAPQLRGPQNLRDPDGIVAFLTSMTDPEALDLSHLVPASVPSGLPVAD
jgi:cytochrome c peroxidase